jgi:putative intracellular protease/amidase
MSRTVHLAVYDTWADWEAGLAIANINTPVWHDETYKVVAVAESLRPVKTMGGITIQPDLALADLHPDDSAMLILPGAVTWDTGGNMPFVTAARSFLQDGVPVAATCGGTFGLASAGLLNDRDHTSASLDYLQQSPAYRGETHYRDERAVTDGDLITAGPADAVPFARHVFARLGLMLPPVLDAWHGLFSTGDARFFGDLVNARQAASQA